MIPITPLRAFDEVVIERRDLPEFELEPRCANPRCPNRADDKHEIYPRSQAIGVVNWVELPGRFLLGNRVGLCRGCHESNDAHDTQILWFEAEQRFFWINFGERWAEPLEPMPPIHKIAEAELEPEIPPIPASVLDEEPETEEPAENDERAANAEALRQRIAATKSWLRSIEPRDIEYGPFVSEEPPQDVLELHEPVGSTIPVVENENVPAGTAAIVGPEGLEGAIVGIEPLRVDVVQPEVPREELEGSDERTLQAAREVTEQAQQRASSSIETVPETGTRFRADLAIDPESYETEILAGDMRAKILVDALAAAAKRAPKPRQKRSEDPDRPREPAKRRATWAIHVPKEAREEGLLEMGEDGASLLDAALELARERIGAHDDDFPGWKYLTLIDVLNWFAFNYTGEGENA